MLESADEWLRDPEDASRYELGPRAEEIWVIIREDDGRRSKVRLSALLERAKGSGTETPAIINYRHADPRTLLLQAVKTQQGNLTMLRESLELLQEMRRAHDEGEQAAGELHEMILRRLSPPLKRPLAEKVAALLCRED